MQISWVTIVGFIASGGLTVIVQALGNALPNEAKVIANIAAVLVALATVLYQLATQPTKSIIQDAAIKDEAGNTVATNVSTTSNAFVKTPVA